MAKIRLSDFGPIIKGYTENEGYIDFKKVTVFIGDQGMGKSTLGKLYSLFSWLEKAVYQGKLSEKELTTAQFKKRCTYHRIDGYFNTNTILEYRGDICEFHYRTGKFTVKELATGGTAYTTPKIMYVPAERNFLSVVNNPQRLKQLPAPLDTFLEELVKAQESLKSAITLPLPNFKYEYKKLNRYSYIIVNDSKRLGLSETSSGLQSLTPLFLVSRHLAKTISERSLNLAVSETSIEERQKIEQEVKRIMSNPDYSEDVREALLKRVSARSKNDRFMNIVEEMEQNLYPASQRLLLNTLLEYVNETDGNSLVLTTHSPYIINYLSLAIKACELLRKDASKIANISEIVPSKSVICGEDVVVYELRDGNVHKLKTYDNMPDDSNMLNHAIENTNDDFDRLLDIEENLS